MPYPSKNTGSISWGITHLTGRGQAAVVGKGQIMQIELGDRDSYVVSPKSLIAYAASLSAPLPYRISALSLRIRAPDQLAGFLSRLKFFRVYHLSY